MSRLDQIDPAEVRGVFLKSGWKGMERTYGVSNPVLMQLIDKAGGAELLAERRAVQPCGRKAGGRGPVAPAEPRASAPFTVGGGRG